MLLLQCDLRAAMLLSLQCDLRAAAGASAPIAADLRAAAELQCCSYCNVISGLLQELMLPLQCDLRAAMLLPLQCDLRGAMLLPLQCDLRAPMVLHCRVIISGLLQEHQLPLQCDPNSASTQNTTQKSALLQLCKSLLSSMISSSHTMLQQSSLKLEEYLQLPCHY